MRVAICDTDSMFVDYMKRQLNIVGNFNVIDCYLDKGDILADLVAGSYDIIFMEIEFGSGKVNSSPGLSIAASLYEEQLSSKIILLTKDISKFASYIFLQKINVAGLFQKPIDWDILKKNIEIIGNEFEDHNDQKMVIKSEGKSWVIAYDEIFYIESKGHFLDIVTGQKKYRVKDSMIAIIERLPENFIRCHKGFIVNKDRVLAFSAGELLMEDGNKIPIGRKYGRMVKENLRQILI